MKLRRLKLLRAPLPLATLFLLAVWACPAISAAEEASQVYQDAVRPFLSRHCVECHGADTQEGKLRLDTLLPDLANREAARHWVEVMDRLNLGEMPPEDEPRPDVEQIQAVTRWIAAELRKADRRALSRGGRVLLRRLNRTEYANTIRDLLAMQFLPGEGPLHLLPPDGTAEGFDKVSAALMLDPSLLEKYYDVAASVAEKAIVTGPPRFRTETMRFELEDTRTSIGISYLCSQPGFICRENDIILMENGTRTFAVMKYPGTKKHIPTKGMYRVRVRAAADPGQQAGPVVMRVKENHPEESQQLVMEVPVTAGPDAPKIYEAIVPRDAKGAEWSISLEEETRFTLYNRPAGDLYKEIEKAGQEKDYAKVIRLRGRMHAEGLTESGRPNPDTTDIAKLPKLYLDWIEIQGPLYEQWPPKSHEMLFFRGQEAKQDLQYAREIFARFLPRAWRRPVSEEEVAPIVRLVQAELEQGCSFAEAVRAGLTAALTSPKFLYLVEQGGPKLRPLNDFELASRLSYFLWSSMPDDELFRLAAAGRLRDAKVLFAQVDRMLADEKGAALVTSFGGQWLRTHEFRNFTPDARLYPQYRDKLGEAMVQQALAFFQEVLAHDRSVLAMIDSDWTMLNQPLAEFYGIDGVTGEAFVRVDLPGDSPRGGLLGMAGVAMRGSDGNRTKPVNRGVYVREVLFNDPPDPPPANAGEVEPNIRGNNLTVRERLLQHQQVKTCAACHRNIDCYGLALENFNAIGQWRDLQDGENFHGKNRPEIVASGTLPGGQSYEDFRQFKALLLTQDERFARALAEKMFVYALGRPLQPTDRTTIDALTQQMKADNYTLRSLIKGIVTSKEFLQK